MTATETVATAGRHIETIARTQKRLQGELAALLRMLATVDEGENRETGDRRP